MTLRMSPLAIAGLAGLACLNAWLLVLVLESPAAEVVAQAQVAAPDQLPDSSEIKPLKPVIAYSQTLAKPVFFKDRTPYVAPPPKPPPPAKPAAAPSPPPADPNLVLGGVVITEEMRKAYIFKKGNTRGAWLSEGETILEWKVESIGAMTAKLQQAGRSIELQLYPRR